MVAAVLHLQDGAGAALDGIDHRWSQAPLSHDVGHGEAVGIGRQEPAPDRGIALPCVADDAGDLRHGAEGLGLGLGGAAG